MKHKWLDTTTFADFPYVKEECKNCPIERRRKDPHRFRSTGEPQGEWEYLSLAGWVKVNPASLETCDGTPKTVSAS